MRAHLSSFCILQKCIPTPCKHHAFSLVELSIVLVILGLLVGGILSGRSLIRASELRSLTTDYDKYRTALATFREKYFYLPGDMANATQIWGYSGSTGCINRSGTAATAPGTCDGNGNGLLEYGTVANQTSEVFQGWRQLALAGMIPGNYTGLAGANTENGLADDYDFGTNSPASRISNVGWSLTYANNLNNAYSNVFVFDYTNWFSVGSDDNIYADGQFLTTAEAWNIDNKIDDGLPGQGVVQSWPVCSTAANNHTYSGTYALSDTITLCPLLFKQ